MVAPYRQWDGVCLDNLREECSDAFERTVEVNRVHGRVTEIRDTAEFVGRNLCDGVYSPDQCRHFADLPRAVARPWPIRRTPIPGDANDGDIQLARIGHHRKPHEC